MNGMILIVEGKNDYSKIKQIFPEMNVMITGGSAVSEEFLQDVKKASEHYQIVIFTDPDSPGEKIRKKIQEAVPNASHIFIDKKKAISKNNKKVGVEHATKEELINALEKVYAPSLDSDINFDFLYDLGLSGEANSKEKRLWLCEKLGIGYVNSKQLLNRLNLFGFTKEYIMEVCNGWKC